MIVDAFTAEPFRGNPAAVCFLAGQRPDVTFVGRLAQYRYYNMDQVVAAALAAAADILRAS